MEVGTTRRVLGRNGGSDCWWGELAMLAVATGFLGP